MKKSLIAAAAAVLVAGGAHAANLINNGDFETGDFTGWTLTSPDGFTFVTPGNAFYTPESGNFFVALGDLTDATLSQTFADKAGVAYDVSFYLASDGDVPNDFGVTGPGSLVIDPSYVSATSYTEYYASFVGSGSDTITFTASNTLGYLSLDNVSVTLAVPEPAAWATMLLGLGFAGAALRRRRSVTA